MAVAKRPDLKGNMSLETCASEILDVIVDKSDDLIFTDWEADDLDDRSLMYACTDADLVFQINRALSEDTDTGANDGGDGDDDTRAPVDLAGVLGAPDVAEGGDSNNEAPSPGAMEVDGGGEDSNNAPCPDANDDNTADSTAGAKNLDGDADEAMDAADLTWNVKKVLQDILHLIQRYDRNVSTKHVLHSAFMAALRDAIFVCNQDEIDAVVEQLRKRGVGRDEIRRIRRRYYTRTGRVRRSVPPPNELAERVEAVVSLFKLITANDADPLFLKGFKDAHESQMRLIRDGFVRRVCSSSIFWSLHLTLGLEQRPTERQHVHLTQARGQRLASVQVHTRHDGSRGLCLLKQPSGSAISLQPPLSFNARVFIAISARRFRHASPRRNSLRQSFRRFVCVRICMCLVT